MIRTEYHRDLFNSKLEGREGVKVVLTQAIYGIQGDKVGSLHEICQC